MVASEVLPSPPDKCVVLNGGQSNECQQAATAFGLVTPETFTGTEARLTAQHVFSQSATFAFIADANGCQGQPKQVRMFLPVVADGAVDVTGINGNSVTYCNCVLPD